MFEPPLWAIRAICGGGGRWQMPRDWSPVAQPPASTGPPVIVSPGGFVVGNLPLGTYRFWVGLPDSTKKDCWCRFCGFHAESELERKRHQDAQEPPTCQENLLRAYAILGVDRACVVCDERTTKVVFGVPLCKQVCIDK